MKCYSEEHIGVAVEDAEKYKQINRETPGFFDVAINTGKINCRMYQLEISHITDSLSESYQRLKVLVMAYGGIIPDSSASSRPTTQLTMSTSTSSEMIIIMINISVRCIVRYYTRSKCYMSSWLPYHSCRTDSKNVVSFFIC